jgi:hypothetical protein
MPSFWDEPELRCPRFTPLVDILAPRRSAPGEIIYQYGGLQGVIVNRILSYHHTIFFSAVDAAANRGNLSLFDVDRITLKYEDNETDIKYGRWWDRNFFESFTPEHGGAKATPEIVQIGQEFPILEIDELSITNVGRLKLGHTEVYVQRTIIDTSSVKSIVTGIVRREEFKVSDYVCISLRPRISIKGSLKPEEILSKVELGVNIKIYYDVKKPPIALISIVAESQPLQRRGDVLFSATLLVW